jgi:hypothetical protein
MIGFNLIRNLNTAKPEDKDRLIAEAIEELELKTLEIKALATREDIKNIEISTLKYLSTLQQDIQNLEIRLTNKMQTNLFWIIGSIGLFGVLNHWLFK